MRKPRVWLWVLVPVALCVGLLTFARASASGPFCRGFHGHAPAKSAAEVEQHLNQKLEHVLDTVDASAAQRSQVAAIAKQLSPQLFAVMGEGHALRTDLKNALLAEQIDASRIEALRARLDTVSERLFDTSMDGLVGVANVLTPAQRKQVADKLARMHL